MIIGLALVLALSGEVGHCCGGPVFIGPYVIPGSGPSWWWTSYYPIGSGSGAYSYGGYPAGGYSYGYGSGGYGYGGWNGGYAGQASWANNNYYYNSPAYSAPSGTAASGSTSTGSAEVPGPNTVTIQDGRFQPDNLTVPVGSVVTWTNRSGSAHTVTSDRPELFDSRDLQPGQQVQYRFNQPGVYTYHCQYEGYKGMVGTVTVVSGAPTQSRPAPAGVANPRLEPSAPPPPPQRPDPNLDSAPPPPPPARTPVPGAARPNPTRAPATTDRADESSDDTGSPAPPPRRAPKSETPE